MQRALRIDPAGAAPPQARALQATVKQASDDAAGGAGGGDALRTLRREEGEEWVPMKWVDQDDEAAWEVFEGMFLPGTRVDDKEKQLDTDGDTQMQELNSKIKNNSSIPKLKTTITKTEYLHLLAAPRIDKD